MEVQSMSSSSKASERVNALLDDNSFVEVGARVTARSTNFNVKPEQTPSDGVITGYGTIDGSLVFVYSQDSSVLGGSIGEMHAKKITGLYDLALKTGAPIIGLLDSAGLRLQEGTDALNAFASIYAKEAEASGVIPQIAAVFGNCGGGLAVAAGMADFTFMAKDAKLFVNSPNALAGNSEDKKDTAVAAYKAEAGAVDAVGTEAEVLEQIRALVSILPSNNEDEAAAECDDDLNRASANVANGIADPSVAAADLSDGNLFVETKADYAKEMATGFIKLNGETVGVIANRTASYDEKGEKTEEFKPVLTVGGAQKAADFVSFCDAFEIPVVTLTNVSGFCTCECAEKKIAKAAAKLAAAFAGASVPKVNVVVGEAFGSAYTVMNSKALGADITMALPDARIGMMDGNFAAKVIAAGKDAAAVAETAKAYNELQNSIDSAAAHGYVDQIVEPADLRKYLIGALEMLYTKREDFPAKKHMTV
jgi:acetyl-CoA carboxylase carboxyltransferase component